MTLHVCHAVLLQGYCCASGSSCVKGSEWYYQCLPSTTSSSTAAVAAALAAATGEGVSAAAAHTIAVARQAADVLEISGPPTAAAGSLLQVTITASRRGAAVAGTNIQLNILTQLKKGNAYQQNIAATLTGKTNASGVASFKVPRRLRGKPGAVTTFSALTTTARVQGAKGNVIVSALPVTTNWV